MALRGFEGGTADLLFVVEQNLLESLVHVVKLGLIEWIDDGGYTGGRSILSMSEQLKTDEPEMQEDCAPVQSRNVFV